ncbi:hypothetical protein [Paludisphaera soli]|uniref:hypothetical protein n=1 Tax=Paludisphaera soli TaxID=2712865 RepID=UPI0013EBB00C|nr:hypothetical protein [Paludisphaera soli]
MSVGRLLPLALPLLLVAAAGCGPTPGAAGLWDLRVGGEAKLAGAGDAPDVVVRLPVAPPASARSTGRASRAAAKDEDVALPAGTRVEILAVDGDDARVRIAEGPHAGSIGWIECRRLEPTP